eukprot:2876884-Lingulodinium_polyedra.AAC.1
MRPRAILYATQNHFVRNSGALRARPGAALRASWGHFARDLGSSCAFRGRAALRIASRAYSGHTIASTHGACMSKLQIYVANEGPHCPHVELCAAVGRRWHAHRDTTRDPQQ